MSINIEQAPLYKTLPVGQDIIFTVSSDVLVASKYNVKFTAEIYIDVESSNIYNPSSYIAKLKVTPNNVGRGIFSLQPVLESYVSAQHQGTNFDTIASQYKGTAYSDDNPHPIHLIDKYANNKNNARYFGLIFNIEYYNTADAVGTPQTLTQGQQSFKYFYFDGVLDFDEVLKVTRGNYGYNLDGDKLVLNDYYGTLGQFLTNAPTTQYAKLTDYGTLSFLNFLNSGTYSFQVGTDNATINMMAYININLYDRTGAQQGSSIRVDCTDTNGGFQYNNDFSNTRIMYFGAFPANLDNWSTDWDTHKANTAYYTIQAFDDEEEAISQIYTINIIGNSCKGFESIRLTWLNQYGTWDYYTFKKKSVKSLRTNRTSYTQQSGTWNEKKYKIRGFKGGKKNFRVNTKQLISINTDFINESESIWFENLMNSTDVYLLNGYDSDVNDTRYGIVNKYVEPVRVTTSNYVRKTIANDKLIQYTFEIEKTKNKRTQSV